MLGAIQNGSPWVLKPQREGGGNNLYGAELVEFLQKYQEDSVLSGAEFIFHLRAYAFTHLVGIHSVCRGTSVGSVWSVLLRYYSLYDILYASAYASIRFILSLTAFHHSTVLSIINLSSHVTCDVTLQATYS